MEEVDLVGCFDAQVWAKEFCKRNTSSDEGTMLGWFANAIMAGYDYAKQEAKLETNGKKVLERSIKIADEKIKKYNGKIWE